MKHNRNSIYLSTDCCDSYSIKLGFNWFVGLKEEDERKNRGLVAFGTKRLLSDFLSPIFGDKVINKFIRNNRMIYNYDIYLSIFTEQTRMHEWNGPILAIAPTQKLLDKIDDLNFVTDVLVIPYTLEEIQPWVNTWNAYPYGSSPPSERGNVMISNPIVAVAIDSLSTRVNESTGIGHLSDRDAAIALFRILKNNGTFFKPDEIRAYLISRHNWSTKNADQVAKLATDILNNKRLRCGRGGWKENIYEIWKNKANADGGGV